MRILVVLLGIALCMPQAVWAKAKSEARPAAKTTSPRETINLLSLQEGTIPVVEPACYNDWTVDKVLDESSETGWASQKGKVAANVFVFELAVPAALERFEFDTASIDEEGAGAKDVLVEVSPDGKDAKYETVLQASLEDKADNQSFKAAKVKPAHWVRLTLRNNHGSPEYTELFSIRGFGVKPPVPAPLDKISGTYETTYSKFHMLQQGTALQGCYEFQGGMLNGTIEGRVMKITWSEEEGKDTGPAVMTFAGDGQSFQGYWWRKGQEAGGPSGRWDGKKSAQAVGGCPHWEGSLGGEMKKKLKDEGRVQVYGILFDLDKAVIRSESRPVLDEMLEVLNAEPAWKLTIEGHTDASGSDAHNQTLSQQRADAVKAYLVADGIAEDRLQTKGFGESKPVADNATELGRAQNRRVELVRQ
jgi:outer membrane protein OmpA-like peptidoglycan-associated protein